MKTLDLATREEIRNTPTPGAAQRRGRCLAVRADWSDVKLGVMEDLVRDKFNRHPDLGLRLRETRCRPLVEGNDWGDRFWGVCGGDGLNHLGEILMVVRAELLNDADDATRARTGSKPEPGLGGVDEPPSEISRK
jgi:hypothetical protein